MEKLKKDGKVAVVISAGYGAGWSTWNDPKYAEFLAMDAGIARSVLHKRNREAVELANSVVPQLCELGADDLEIEWVEEGRKFSIVEYDGSESIVFPTLEA